MNYLRVRPWNLGHLWTLSVEEQFYFLWPCLLLFFWRKRVQILLAAILLAPLVRILYGAAGAADIGSMSFPAVQDAIAVGFASLQYGGTGSMRSSLIAGFYRSRY